MAKHYFGKYKKKSIFSLKKKYIYIYISIYCSSKFVKQMGLESVNTFVIDQSNTITTLGFPENCYQT